MICVGFPPETPLFEVVRMLRNKGYSIRVNNFQLEVVKNG